MKRSLNMVIIIALMLQCNSFIPSDVPQQQGMTERLKNWLWSKFQAAKAPALGAAVGYGISQIDPRLRQEVGLSALNALGVYYWGFYSSKEYEKAIFAIGTVGIMIYLSIFFGLSASLVKNVATNPKRYNEELERFKAEVELLVYFLINNGTLYPTYTSKVNALIKKDDFPSRYAKVNFFNSACDGVLQVIVKDRAELKKKLAEEPWQELYYIGKTKEEWKKALEREAAIDKYIGIFKAGIFELPLEEQIKSLEGIRLGAGENDTYLSYDARMAAFASVYGRLKNKLEVERVLNVLEKASRGAWQEAAQKAYKEAPVEKKQMSKEDQEKYRKEYLKKRQAALQKRQGKMPEGTPKLPGIMTEEEVKAYEIEGEELKKKAQEAEEELKRKREARSATIQ